MNYDFITIPRYIVLSDKIRDGDRLVYGVIYSMSQMNNKRFTGKNTTIAKMCGIAPQSVANALVRLSDAGFIKCSFKDNSKRVRTEIIPLINFKNDQEYTQVSKEVYSNEETKVYSNEEQNNNTCIYNNNINNIYKSLFKINNLIYKIGNNKKQREDINILLKQEDKRMKEEDIPSVEHVEQIIDWYVGERLKGTNKYLPIANVPSQLIEKWARIKELYNLSTGKSLTKSESRATIDDIRKLMSNYDKQ